MTQEAIKVLIVDDEPLARNYIRDLISVHPDFEVVGEAGNGKAALKKIAQMAPDLIFLDVQMPEMDGFSMLQNLKSAEMPVVVFSTAFEDYAIRAFEVHALDYLLKPFDQQRFDLALDHARQQLAETELRGNSSEQIAELIRSINEKPRYLERVLVKRQGRILFVKMDKIDWIKADDKYVHLCGENEKHLIRQTLAGLKTQLDPAKFVQINRSVIVNVDSIKELHAMFNGDHEVQLRDGSKFPLSRNHRNELFDLVGKPMS